MISLWIRAATVLVLAFALGVLAGIAFERHHGSSPPRSAKSSEKEHEAAMAELRDELGLDEEQVAQIHAILQKHHAAVQQSWEQLRPEVQRAMGQVHVEIAELLRPEQRRRFHEWLLRRREEGVSHGR